MTRSWRQREGGKIKPRVKICENCHERKVKYHHCFCEKCWRLNKKQRAGIKEALRGK